MLALILLGGPACRARDFPGAAGPGRVRPYAILQVLATSEPNAIMDAIDGWHGPYGPGKRQYVWSWAEAGVRGGHWGVGSLVRWDYDLAFSQDAAALYGAIQNKKDLPTGKVFQVRVDARVIHAAGVRGSWRGDLDADCRAEVGLSLLRCNYMIDGGIRGTARVTGPRQYEYGASIDYAYTTDVLFERGVSPRDGIGLALDAAIDWRFPSALRLKAQVRDFPGCIWWHQLPYTTAAATSNRTTTDSGGFTHWDPLVSGVESSHPSYRQDLPPRGEMELSLERHPWVPVLGLNVQFGDVLPRLGLFRGFDDWQVGCWGWPTTRALGLEVNHGPWKVGLSMDNLQWGLVKAVNLTVAWNG